MSPGRPARFALRHEPLDVNEVRASVAGPGMGALVEFVGAVRGTARGRTVVRLEYEAYEGMALKQFALISAEIETAIPGAAVAIHHRVGPCGVGEAGVVIVAASPHRAAAFDACRQAIERLKADAPLWKREVYDDGSHWAGQGS